MDGRMDGRKEGRRGEEVRYPGSMSRWAEGGKLRAEEEGNLA